MLGTHVGTSMRQRSVGLVRNISQLEATLELTARLLLGHYYANWTLRSWGFPISWRIWFWSWHLIHFCVTAKVDGNWLLRFSSCCPSFLGISRFEWNSILEASKHSRSRLSRLFPLLTLLFAHNRRILLQKLQDSWIITEELLKLTRKLANRSWILVVFS